MTATQCRRLVALIWDTNLERRTEGACHTVICRGYHGTGAMPRSRGSTPDRKSKLPTFRACGYAPMDSGAFCDSNFLLISNPQSTNACLSKPEISSSWAHLSKYPLSRFCFCILRTPSRSFHCLSETDSASLYPANNKSAADPHLGQNVSAFLPGNHLIGQSVSLSGPRKIFL